MIDQDGWPSVGRLGSWMLLRGALGFSTAALLGGGCLAIYDYGEYSQCQGEPNPNACRQCRDAQCDVHVEACEQGGVTGLCSTWLGCINACAAEDAVQCFQSCGDQGGAQRSNVINCMCGSCAEQCQCFACP